MSEDPNESVYETWCKLGLLSLELNQFQLGKQCLTNAMKYRLDGPIVLQVGKALVKLKEVHEISKLIKLIEESTEQLQVNQNHQISYAMANLYFEIGDTTKALKYMQQCLDLNNQKPDYWFLNALIMLHIHNEPEYIHSITYSLSLNPCKTLKFEILLHLGKFYLQKFISTNDDTLFTKAVDYFNSGLHLLYNYDYYAKLYYRLILAYLNKFMVDEAVFYSQQSVLIVNNNYDLMVLSAFTLVIQTENHLSIRKLNHLLNYPQASKDYLPWLLLGLNYFKINDFKNSFDCLEVCLKKNTKSSEIWLLIGNLYLKLNQLPDSLSAYSQALRLHDEISMCSALAWDGLSCVYERCDNQLMDASDACTRSANCFQSLHDTNHAELLAARAEFLKAFTKNKQTLDYRNPIELPISFFTSLFESELEQRISTETSFPLVPPPAAVPSPPLASLQVVPVQVKMPHPGPNGASLRNTPQPTPPSALITQPGLHFPGQPSPKQVGYYQYPPYQMYAMHTPPHQHPSMHPSMLTSMHASPNQPQPPNGTNPLPLPGAPQRQAPGMPPSLMPLPPGQFMNPYQFAPNIMPPPFAGLAQPPPNPSGP